MCPGGGWLAGWLAICKDHSAICIRIVPCVRINWDIHHPAFNHVTFVRENNFPLIELATRGHEGERNRGGWGPSGDLVTYLMLHVSLDKN